MTKFFYYRYIFINIGNSIVYMLPEDKFFIKYYSDVFFIRCSFNLNILETNIWMTLRLLIPWKYYFLGWFTRIWSEILSLAMVKRDVTYAKTFALDFIPFGKSLMQTRKRSGPKVDLCRTPAKTSPDDDDWAFKTTFGVFQIGNFQKVCEVLLRCS